jgi:hypothetical protein
VLHISLADTAEQHGSGRSTLALSLSLSLSMTRMG